MLDFATLALNAIQRLRGHDPRMGTESRRKDPILFMTVFQVLNYKKKTDTEVYVFGKGTVIQTP